MIIYSFFFSSRRRHTRWPRDWSSDVCSSDLKGTDINTELFGCELFKYILCCINIVKPAYASVVTANDLVRTAQVFKNQSVQYCLAGPSKNVGHAQGVENGSFLGVVLLEYTAIGQ